MKPPKLPTLHVRLDHDGDGGATLRLQVSKDPKWLEVRGRLDEDSLDPLQQVVDSLSGPLVGGELMAGATASVTPTFYAQDYPVLTRLLQDHP